MARGREGGSILILIKLEFASVKRKRKKEGQISRERTEKGVGGGRESGWVMGNGHVLVLKCVRNYRDLKFE